MSARRLHPDELPDPAGPDDTDADRLTAQRRMIDADVTNRAQLARLGLRIVHAALPTADGGSCISVEHVPTGHVMDFRVESWAIIRPLLRTTDP